MSRALFNHDSWQATPPESLSAEALDWFNDKGSLTKRLRAFTHNKITFCLLHNDWDGQKENWVRNIEWRYEGMVWMACELRIPKDSFIDELQSVGDRPIGEILFTDPSTQRSDFYYQSNDNYHTRKSTFHFRTKPFDLVETFFPAFFETIANEKLPTVNAL